MVRPSGACTLPLWAFRCSSTARGDSPTAVLPQCPSRLMQTRPRPRLPPRCCPPPARTSSAVWP
eukprot:12301007-Alexandrium_andersonii.AAC.1